MNSKINLSETLKKAGNFVKENPKPLLYLGGAIALTVIGYAVVKKAKGGIEGLFTDKSKGETSFKKIPVDDRFSSINDSVASNYANQLYNAMKISGTKEDVILSIFKKIQRKEDFLKVYNAFGTRSYVRHFGENPDKLIKFFGLYSNLDLVEWLQEEISTIDKELYDLVKKTVNNAGLAF
jgi:hypothetical protein